MKIYNELESLGFFEWLSETHNLKDTDMTPECLDELPLNDIHRTVCNSMAFRWFRENHKLFSQPDITIDKNGNWFYFTIYHLGSFKSVISEGSFIYEDAELTCLKKLIEIVKK